MRANGERLFLIINEWQKYLWSMASFAKNVDYRLVGDFERPSYRDYRYGNAQNVFHYSTRLANICIDLNVSFTITDN